MVALAHAPIVNNFPLLSVLPLPDKAYTAIITAYFSDRDYSDTLVINFKAHDDADAFVYAQNHGAIIREHGCLYPGSETRVPNVPDWVNLVMVARAPLVYLFDECIINPYLCI